MNSGLRKYVVVIGATNLDINFLNKNKIIINESNIGNFTLSAGGVARNISENIVKLGNECHLVSVFGNDIFSEFLKRDCRKKNIIIENSIFLKNETSSTYISINNQKGEMKYGFNDTSIMDNLNIDHIKKLYKLISTSSAIVIETNISQKVFKFLMKTFKEIPIFVDTVSTIKSKKILPFLKDIYFLKPNFNEAKKLLNLDKKNTFSKKNISQKLHLLGLKKIFITDGKNNAFYSDSYISKKYIPPRVNILNVSGAGDSIISGIVHGFINNWDWDYTNKFALSLSALNLESTQCVNPKINQQKVKNFIKAKF